VRVGVIVPVHGFSPYLAEALDAILGQDPAPDEVVVVDDGSPEPVALHVDHATRCRLVRRPERGGLPAARRTGLDALRDPALVALCDADDAWRPGKLRAQLGALRRSDGAAGCFARVEVVGPDGRPTGEPPWPLPEPSLPALYERNTIAVSGALLRVDAVRRAGGIAHDAPAAEDYDLWLRLLANGERLIVAPDAVVAYRRHPGAMSGDLALLAREQLRVHARHAALVDTAARRRVEAADLRALAAGEARARRWAAARDALRRSAALEPLPPPDRARLAALAVPGVRAVIGRREPYARSATGRPSRGPIVGI
jgi:glycosyltransferase involved in cell wall biosynthesis